MRFLTFRLYAALFAVLVCLTSAGTAAAETTAVPADGVLSVYFIDLDVPKDSKDKSGDSTLVISPDKKVMLIDCGHPAAAKDVVKALRAAGVTAIDVFVNSHPHIDHIGGFPEIAAAFKIGTVYRSRLEYDTRYTRAFTETVEKKKIPVKYLSEGDSLTLGNDVTVRVFGPQKDIAYPDGYPANATQFINDNSVSMQLRYGQSTVLLCGDLYRSGEKTVLDGHEQELKSLVAKANHHGNDTSSQKRWIRAVQPQVVVAMNDILGSLDVVDNYIKRGAVFYHTLYNGTVKITLDRAGQVSVFPEKESWIEKRKPE